MQQLGSLIREIGPGFTSNANSVRAVLDAANANPLSESAVARIIATMSEMNFDSSDGGTNRSWDYEVLASVILERSPSLEWYTVIRSLDMREFYINDTYGLSVVVNIFKAATKDIFKFPIHAFFGEWQNAKSQLSFLKHAIFATPELFSFSCQLGTSRRVLSDSILMGKQISQALLNLPWNNLDLLETLVTMSESGGNEVLEDVKAILDVAIQQSPEFVLIGLAQIPAPWTPLHKEFASALVIMFLANNNGTGFVVSILWQLNPNLVLAGLVHIYSKDPSQLSRILDIVQEFKALTQILETKSFFFVLDLAVLASRRGFVSFEKWFQDRLMIDRSSSVNSGQFVKASLEFLSEKVSTAATVLTGNVNPGSVNLLPWEIIAIFLRNLRACPMTPEMALYFKELVAVSCKLYPQLVSQDNEVQVGLSDANHQQPATSDAESQANLLYSKLLKGEVAIAQAVELLRRYRESPSQSEQDVFSTFAQIHLDEYKYFSQYPDRQLQITSMLFGALIQEVYVDAKNLAAVLRCVLDALRHPLGNKYYRFGTIALSQFQGRLREWPHYCALLLQIPHFVQTNPDLAAFITPLATGQDSNAAVSNSLPADNQSENPSNGKVDSPKPVFTALKLDSPDASENDTIEEPEESMKDNILFNINNLTFENLNDKLDEIQEGLSNGKFFRWFSQYIVVKRASIEPNNHDLYIALIDGLKSNALIRHIIHETLANIRVLLNSDKTVSSSSERTLLKNLGTWLGAITVAKNKPIKHKNLAVKDLLLEGYDGNRLIVVIPFVCKVLEQAHASKVFKPPNPWVMAIMKLLSELYHYADLKLNLKFEIEVLCKKIQLDIKDIEPSVMLRNRPLKSAEKKGAGEALGLPSTIAQTGEDSLYPIYGYIQLPNLPIFNLQPMMKRVVHIAIDRAIREVIGSPVVERSVTIASIATRELVIKDFALEPNEEKMRKGAHLMVQNLAGSLAMVSSRDPLRVGMIAQLQNLLRQNGITEQAVSEQVVYSIVMDNLDLACSVMERAAADKSLIEIDDALSGAYLSRRNHRERSSQPYYDVNVYAASRYPSSLPEPLKLKPNGLNASQFRVYEDFRNARQVPTSSELDNDQELTQGDESESVLPIAADDHGVPSIVVQAMEKLDLVLVELDKIIVDSPSASIAELPAQHEIKSSLRSISQFMSSFQRDDLLIVTGQKLLGQLYKVDSQLSRECYVLLLERAFELSKTVGKEVINWVLYSFDPRRLNVPVFVILIRANLLPIMDVDSQLARIIDIGQEGAIEFSVNLIRAVLLDEIPYAAYDAFFGCLAMLAEYQTEDERIPVLLSDLKISFSVTTLRANDGSSLSTEELREKLKVLFSSWVKIYHHPSSSEKSHKEFVTNLQELGVLQEEDVSSMFFRVCCELSVDLYIQAKAHPGTSRLAAFQAVDAFARLIVLLVRYCVEPEGVTNSSAKLDLTTKILYIIVLVLVHSHEQKRSQFNQKPFFRLFSCLLNDLNLFEDYLQSVYYQILYKISNTLHTLQPSFLPGFTLSWLQLISHRFFMPKLLSADGQKGWPFFQRLLVDLFKFLGPFLRQSEMAEAIRLLYKASLRILLVLLHDFPEFLCDYHFSFVEVIPHSCVQLRNLILSAFPHNMRLPDPFTPNLRVDLLPEINQSPHIMSDYTSALNAGSLKADLDSFIRQRAPSQFLTGLPSRLVATPAQENEGMKYNVPVLNALVLYVGVQAIAQGHLKSGQSTSTLSPSASMDIFQQLIAELDSEGRYLLLSAIANQLRYPNCHTHYFSCVLLYLFAEAKEEIIQEQITRVLIERLIVNRPHPYGLLITFIELIRNQRYNFWEHTNFIRCAPEIERLFSSVHKSIQSSMARS